ncbi:Fic family protein [Cryobacterium sp. 10I1]|uniref:Fic/DOC family protein n=1 Tax=Cryobacterium sp. 10I1 TaxID=3048578 RepID=UPI002B228E9B|nr:Fic family protein [Cryobacterium sp. 10I1]MEB0304066.1 Fic family protein [Cryobacterium sp. 10I1]
MATKFRAWDDYFIPGTTVLRNKFNERDPAALSAKEEFAASARLDQLANEPVPAVFDYDHMKAIHRYVFQDVYEWAGEERVGPVGFMSKEGHSYYPGGPSLTAAAEAEYVKLASKDLLRGLDKGQFVDELAERWGELNVIHSFREGNTRTQFVFFSQFAEQAGYRIDTGAFQVGSPLREEFVQARFHSQDTGSNTRLAAVLSKAIEPVQSGRAMPPPLSPELGKIVDMNKRDYPTSATEIGRPAQMKAPEARGYQPPAQLSAQGLGTDYGYGR